MKVVGMQRPTLLPIPFSSPNKPHSVCKWHSFCTIRKASVVNIHQPLPLLFIVFHLRTIKFGPWSTQLCMLLVWDAGWMLPFFLSEYGCTKSNYYYCYKRAFCVFEQWIVHPMNGKGKQFITNMHIDNVEYCVCINIYLCIAVVGRQNAAADVAAASI